MRTFLILLCLLMMGHMVYAAGVRINFEPYYCPFHGELKRGEAIQIYVGEESHIFCGKCLLELLKDNLPEVYKLEQANRH